MKRIGIIALLTASLLTAASWDATKGSITITTTSPINREYGREQLEKYRGCVGSEYYEWLSKQPE